MRTLNFEQSVAWHLTLIIPRAHIWHSELQNLLPRFCNTRAPGRWAKAQEAISERRACIAMLHTCVSEAKQRGSARVEVCCVGASDRNPPHPELATPSRSIGLMKMRPVNFG